MSNCSRCGNIRYRSCTCNASAFSTYFPSNQYFYNKQEIDKLLKGIASGGSAGAINIDKYIKYGSSELYTNEQQALASLVGQTGNYLITYDVDNDKGKLYVWDGTNWKIVNSNVGSTNLVNYVQKTDRNYNVAPFTVASDYVQLGTPITLGANEVLDIIVSIDVTITNANNLRFIKDLEFKISTASSDIVDFDSAESGLDFFIEAHMSGNSLDKIKFGMDSDGSTYEYFSKPMPLGVTKILYRKIGVN